MRVWLYSVLVLASACSRSKPGGASDGAILDSTGIGTDQAGEVPLEPRYEPVSNDTTTVTTELRVGNGKYPLSISRILLNDSAVSNITPFSAVDEEAGRKRVFHNRACRIRFEYDGYRLDTIITKELFTGVLADTTLEKSVLLNCEDCLVRSNTLYFQALVGNPLMNDAQFVRFNIFCRGPKRRVIYGFIVDTQGCVRLPSSR